MLVNICMKFHEDILNGFKVTDWTRFCLRNCYLQSSKGHYSKSINTRVMILAFCMSSNVGNICMKFHEDILNGFWVTEPTRPYRKIYCFQFQMTITPKIRNPELWVLRSACRLMLLYICVRFHENISNGFGVWTADTILWQIDRRTDDLGKNKMSPNPKGGDIIKPSVNFIF